MQSNGEGTVEGKRKRGRGNDGQTMQSNGQGTVEGKRKTGRQRKRWTDNAEQWTGNSGGEEKETEETMDRQCRAMDREQWRGRERQADRGNDGQTIIIEEWTGKPLTETQALAHNRSRWRRLGHSLSGRRPDDSTAS